jgi:hypothetical protein
MHRESLSCETVFAEKILFRQLPLDFDICAKTGAAFPAAIADKRYHTGITYPFFNLYKN